MLFSFMRSYIETRDRSVKVAGKGSEFKKLMLLSRVGLCADQILGFALKWTRRERRPSLLRPYRILAAGKPLPLADNVL
jgi:hypothetical protein